MHTALRCASSVRSHAANTAAADLGALFGLTSTPLLSNGRHCAPSCVSAPISASLVLPFVGPDGAISTPIREPAGSKIATDAAGAKAATSLPEWITVNQARSVGPLSSIEVGTSGSIRPPWTSSIQLMGTEASTTRWDGPRRSSPQHAL